METNFYKLPKDFLPRDWGSTRAEELANINNSEIPNLTTISPEELIKLSQEAIHFRMVESPSRQIAGFILAMNEKAIYPSLNFQWFKSRYSHFTYIDRVVVNLPFQRLGIGRWLYQDLEKATQSPMLTCEVNLRPANPQSLNFHKGIGFREVGMQDTEGGKKTVSLMIKDLKKGT